MVHIFKKELVYWLAIDEPAVFWKIIQALGTRMKYFSLLRIPVYLTLLYVFVIPLEVYKNRSLSQKH